MKKTLEKFAKKVCEIADDGRIWKVFYVWYVILFALNLILMAFSDTKRKSNLMNAVSIGMGLGITGYHIERTEKLKAEKK